MKRQIIAIGGGGFGRNPGEGIIEGYILDQSETDKPKVCFIPTATGDDEGYKESYYSTFSMFDCDPLHLDFFKRTPDLERLILDQNIIFVGGGNTKSMLAVWKEWGLDKLLKVAYEKGTIMCGVSAGAICWFDSGVTDSWAEDLKLMDCLGFIEGACCPHFDEEPERRPIVHQMIESQVMDACIAIDGGCALHLINEVPHHSIVFSEKKNAYRVSLENDLINESPFPSKDIF
ncbi:MAG: peptidase E [Gammaproteobacteria bacterium]|jgi:aminopeptidase N|nr:peptidase E [Gammaproteobacteria bacterium]MBQ08928.1 peptidase E [Gammaproteobacteria bacterium]MDP6146550.1 peptidase E [Gammaproteobacteria bacterium]HJL80441.1 peptidase E [Gammaproteobacteria bacterium]HJM09089.1 peptidase E [Gammaproteobacteria bacterium]|tara:strand:+ start:2394 stop:3089 length:696 start_codon:yes stop_codon:yes gene_type:complete